MHHPENKLSPRALKCVFIGYSRTQKGYKCFHPTSHKFYVSADVTFFESTPYFSPHGTSLYESMLEAPAPMPMFSPPESSSPSPASNEIDVSSSVDTSTLRLPIYPSRCLIHLFRVEATHVPTTRYSIDQFVSFSYLSPSYQYVSLSSVSIPPSHVETMIHPDWRVAMEEEIHALHDHNT